MKHDAIVVGAGPNGLAAAITLAEAGLSVKICEANTTIGGGARSAELTLPGFVHDICSAVYPMAIVSPFFRERPLLAHGLEWIQPEIAFAHPLVSGSAGVFPGLSADLTAADGGDSQAWKQLFASAIRPGLPIFEDLLNPLTLLPGRPFTMAKFGLTAMQSAESVIEKNFQTAEVRALFAGLAAHSMLPLEQCFSAATALALGLAGHLAGWPIAKGGSQALSDALGKYFLSLRGEIETGVPIDSCDQLPPAHLILLDLSAKQFAEIYRTRLPQSYLKQIERFRAGPALFKVDWALSAPVPWTSESCKRAGTIHVGGTYEEIAESERAMSENRICEKPFVLLSQPSLFDRSRCPAGKHILWGYCHVPLGSTEDMTERIERQIERFAPGFRDCILAKSVRTPQQLAEDNRNFSGGDITGGAMDWPQIFRRPAHWFNPYRTPIPGVFLCSASTPPGPGVHGMCGYHAAKAALKSMC